MNQQPEPTNIVALEIGSSKIRAAIGQATPGAPVTIMAVEEASLPTDYVRYGVIRNVEKVSNSIERLLSSLSRCIAPRRPVAVYVAIGGRSVSSSVRRIERQLPDEMEIKERLIKELKLDALAEGPDSLPGVDDVIEALPRSFTIDGRSTAHPEGEIGRDITASFVMIAAQDKLRKNIERVVNEKLGLDIAGFILRPLAIADFVLTPEERALGCMLVDFGAETTTVAVFKNSALQYLNTLPIGSRNITRDITALHYLEDQAESLKRAGGHAAPRPNEPVIAGGVDFKEINNYVAARATEIIANIRHQLATAGFAPQELPAGIIIVGAGAKLRGFNERLAEDTRMTVRAGMPSSSIRIIDSSIAPGELIDIIAVMARAADGIPVECLSPMPEPEIVEDPLETAHEQEPEPEQQPKPKPKRRGSGFLGKLGDRIVSIMKGPDDGDDDFGDDDKDFRDDE